MSDEIKFTRDDVPTLRKVAAVGAKLGLDGDDLTGKDRAAFEMCCTFLAATCDRIADAVEQLPAT